VEHVAEGKLVATVCLFVGYDPGLAEEGCMKGAVCHIYGVCAEYRLALIASLLLHTNLVSELSQGHNIRCNSHQHPSFIKPVIER
jgi:hypothetical protein